jgi:subtilisin family serine protease
LKLAEQKGIVVVSAAGNERADLYRDEYFPASYALSNLITVMNYQQNGELNSSSNWNGFIAAPGTDILSTLPNKRLGTMTGTSQATPMVTGTLALLLSYRKLTPTQLKYILSETSDIEYSQLRKTSIRKLNLQKVMKYATQN